MKLCDFCIRRPAFTIVLSLLLILFGLLAFRTTQLSWLPRVIVPAIAINTTYSGASGKTVESAVTTVIESALSGIDGIDYITGISNNGSSTITVYFKVGTDLNAAASDIRGAITKIDSQLPPEVQQPSIAKRNPQASPILIISFVDPSKSIGQLSNYVNQFIKPQLSTVAGVGDLAVWGERQYAMRVWLKPNAMAAHHVTVDDIIQLLKTQNVSVSGGQIRSKQRFFTVNTDIKLQTPEQFANLIVSDRDNQVVRLKQVANVEIGSENYDSLFQVNGKSGIAIGVIAQSDANPLDVTAGVLNKFKELSTSLPSGMQVRTVYNQSNFTHASIEAVYRSLFEAVILVLLVVIAFIGNWRAASIPVVTIPVCLISAFALISLLGYTINTMTLLALVLSIGLVVDDAIVMLENIERRIRLGETPLQAAFSGSKEIAFAILAMTITLAAVYAPLGFASGVTGAFFRQFAFTLAGTIVISGFIALTLSPMMCSRLLNAKQGDNRYQRWVNRCFSQLNAAYQQTLTSFMRNYWPAGCCFLAIIALGIGLMQALPSRLAPAMDQNLVNVYATLPTDASFDNTASYIKQITHTFEGIDGIDSYIPQMGGSLTPNKLYVLVVLKPRNQRKLSDKAIADLINLRAQQIRGPMISASTSPPPIEQYSAGTGDDPSQIPFVIKTISTYKALYDVVDTLKKRIETYPGLTDLQTFTKWDAMQIDVSINRQLAADLQVPMQRITDTLSTMLGSNWINNYTYNGKNYKLMVQLNRDSLRRLDAMQTMFVRSLNKQLIPLTSLVHLQFVTGPLTYLHFDRLRADAIMAKLAPGYSMGDAVSYLSTLQQNLPNDFEASFAGSARSYLQSSSQMLFLITVSLIFIYLVLVAQFESFIDPLTILLTVPFAAVGALFTLWLVGASLNFYSQIGIITLIGLIAKNGVLITDFANELVSKGEPIKSAAIKACGLRLRPILMTAGAMILGALPLALAGGAGAEDRQQIGWVIVGGLFFGTLFSLFIVPAAYTALARLKR